MNRPLFCVLALLCATPLSAQEPLGSPGIPRYAAAGRAPARVTVHTLFQRFQGETPFGGDTTRLAQWSFPVSVSVPITRSADLSVRTSYASSHGDGGEAIRRVSDTQFAVSYSRPVGAGHAVAGLGANIPGSVASTPEEVATAFLFGQGFYEFRTTVAGSGLGVAPSLAWAVPVTARLAVGAGVSYQYRGAFEPRSNVDDPYNPGDELLLTAGVDYRLGLTSSIALDASYVRYGTDTWGDVRYETGDATMATAQWLGKAGPYEVRLVGQVRRRGDREADPETEALLGLNAVIPAEARVSSHALLHLNRRISVGVMAQSRYYARSEAFSSKKLLDVAVDPSVDLTESLTLVGRIAGTVGSIRGVEAGVGLSWSL